MENLGEVNMRALQREMSDVSTSKEKKEKLEKTFYSCLADAMEATDWLHEKQLIHRDIKLENIMVAKAGTAETTKGVLIDFGTTEHASDENLQSASFKRGVVAGTPGYYDVTTYFTSDKEKKNQEVLDPKTDLFAFAVILLEQRTNFSLDAAMKDVASKSQSKRTLHLRFMEKFEEYRKILLKHADEETNKELRQIFRIVFQSREYQDTIFQDDQLEKPTLKKLIEITRKLTE
jgi:serine/threonine protein kinase